MSNALYAVLAMALVTSVGAGVAIHAMDSESPENLVTVEGTVTAVDWNPHFNETVELTLTAANGTNYSVELAPPWWWAERHFPTIHLNDTLKVEGALDDDREIAAFTVWVNGGSAIVLRPGEMPPCAEERSGHTAEDHDNENETEDAVSDRARFGWTDRGSTIPGSFRSGYACRVRYRMPLRPHRLGPARLDIVRIPYNRPMVEIVKVTTKGQLTLPARIRTDLCISKDTYLLAEEVGDFVLLRRAETRFLELSERFQRDAKKRGVTKEELLRALKKTRQGRLE